MSLASLCLPVRMNRPGRVMNVSLPQLRMYPVLKWGRPAATVNPEVTVEARGGRGADLMTDPCWMDPRANSLTKVGPFLTQGDIKSLQTSRQKMSFWSLPSWSHKDPNHYAQILPSSLQNGRVCDSVENVKVLGLDVGGYQFDLSKGPRQPGTQGLASLRTSIQSVHHVVHQPIPSPQILRKPVAKVIDWSDFC